MLLCLKVTQQFYPKLALKNNFELNKYLERVCLGMMDKIGENNARLREKTEEAALAIAGHPSIGPQVVFQDILSKVNLKKQAANSVKHIFGKL